MPETRRKPKQPDKSRKPRIDFTIDDRPHSTTKKQLTVRELLQDFAKVDPQLHYLVEIKGKHQTAYKDLDQEVRLHKGAAFITVSTGPTPVS